MTDMVHTHTVCDHKDVTLWYQGIYTDREGTSNRPHIVIKNNDNVAVPADRNVTQKRRIKETKIQESRYRDTANVEHEIFDRS